MGRTADNILEGDDFREGNAHTRIERDDCRQTLDNLFGELMPSELLK